MTKVHIIMGQTGKVEITASETEGSKWIKASHHIYPVIDGEKQSEIDYCYSGKKKSCIKQIPVGKYALHSTYKDFKKDTLFELKSGEKLKLHISFAPFHLSVAGINQCSEIFHEVISSTGRTVADLKAPAKSGADFVLPDGKYTIESTIDNITQKTKIEIGGDNPTKESVVHFGGEDVDNSIAGLWKTSQNNMTLQLTGTQVTGTYGNDNGTVNGEMTYPQRFEGIWTEAMSDHKCQTSKQGSDYWGKIIWEFDKDMCSFKGKWGYCNKKPNSSWTGTYLKPLAKQEKQSQQAPAKADSASTVTSSNKQAGALSDEEKVLNNLLKGFAGNTTPVNKKEAESKTSEPKTEIQQAQESIAELGKLFNGVQQIKMKPTIAFQKSVKATLPIIIESKTCYENAEDLTQAKVCEELEEKAIKVAQQVMKQETGMMANAKPLDKHAQWNDEIKQSTLKQTTDDIEKMKLSIICIDKGANLANLNKCINNGGNYVHKKSEVEVMGDLLKAFGGQLK